MCIYISMCVRARACYDTCVRVFSIQYVRACVRVARHRRRPG